MQENYQDSHMTTITNSVFIYIIDVCKATKLSLFRVILSSDGNIIEISAMDNNMNYLCICENNNLAFNPDNNGYIELYFRKQDIDNIDMSFPFSQNLEVFNNIIIDPTTNATLLINYSVFRLNFYYFKNMYDIKYLKMKNLILFNNLIDYGEISNDDSIIKMKSCKVSDNIISYIKDRFYMNIYKGIIPAAKADKVYLKIYPLDTVFISNFTIKKKKNIILNFYFLYLNIT